MNMQNNSKTVIDIPESRFLQLESKIAEILERMKHQNASKTSADEKELYTPDEFCDLFKMSRSTFGRMMNENRIQIIKLGRRVYITNEEVKRLMAKNK